MFSQAGCRSLVLSTSGSGPALVLHRREERSRGVSQGYSRRRPQALRSMDMQLLPELLYCLEAIITVQTHRMHAG